MTRFVLFDLDNTLFDRQLAYAQWARSFAERRGLDAEAVRVLCEADDDGFATRHAVFDVARQRLNLTETIEELITEYRKEYTAFLEPDQDAIRALRRLRSNDFRVGVITNGPTTQNEKIERAGLLPLIDGVCISQQFGVDKPDARIFHEAIRRCCGIETPTDEGWMVGDSAAFDIAGGRGVGLRTVWLSRSRTWTETDFFPDVIASSVSDAVEQILRRTHDG